MSAGRVQQWQRQQRSCGGPLWSATNQYGVRRWAAQFLTVSSAVQVLVNQQLVVFGVGGVSAGGEQQRQRQQPAAFGHFGQHCAGAAQEKRQQCELSFNDNSP